MATPLYWRDWNADLLWGSTVVRKSHWNAGDTSRTFTLGDDTVDTLDFLRLTTTVGTGTGTIRNTNTVAGATAGKLWASVFHVTPPLAADVTISGTVNFAVCASESSMNANATIGVAVYRINHLGEVALIVNSRFGTELTTTQARKSWSASPTSTDCKKGDRIAVIGFIDDADTVTMASGHTVTWYYDGSNANTADSSITLTENLTFLSAPSGTSYYLRDTASDVSGAKALNTTQGSGTVTAVHTTVAGPLTHPGDLWTATAGGSDIEWFTPTLNAFTLGGVVAVDLGSDALDQESQFSPFDKFFIEIAVCNSDGSSPVVWARGYAQDHYSGTFAVRTQYITGPDLSVSQGQRLRFRLYQDDWVNLGDDSAEAGTDRTLRYDGTSTYASRLIFTQTITEAGGASHSGAVAFTAAATAAFAGTRSAVGAVAFSAAATAAFAGGIVRDGAVDYSAAASFSASATVTKAGAVAYTGTGTYAATATHQLVSATAHTGTGTFAASGTVTKVGSVAYTTTGSAAWTAEVAKSGVVQYATTGTAAFSGTVTKAGAVAYTGTGTYAALTTHQLSSAAAYAGSGTFAAAATVAKLAAVEFAGTGTFASVATHSLTSATAATGTGTFAAAGLVTKVGAWTATGTGTFAAAGDTTSEISGSVEYTGTGTASWSATVTKVGVWNATGTGTAAFAGDVSSTLSGVVSYDGAGTFSASATVIKVGAITLAGSGSFAAANTASFASSLAGTGTGTFAVQGSVTKVGVWDAAGAGTFNAAATVTKAGAVEYSATGSAAVAATALRPGVVTYSGSGTAAFAGAVEGQLDAEVAFTGTGTFSAAGTFATIARIVPVGLDGVRLEAVGVSGFRLTVYQGD